MKYSLRYLLETQVNLDCVPGSARILAYFPTLRLRRPYILKRPFVKTQHLMKQFLLFCTAGFVLISCQKEISTETTNGGGSTGGGTGGATTYYIKCKINGTARTFNYNDMAKLTDLAVGAKTFSILGSASSDASNLEGVNLSINFIAGAPAAGTYAEDYSGTDYLVAGVYNPNSTTTIYAAGLTANSVLPLTITITKLDSQEATGTFKGAFYKTQVTSGVPTSEYLSFTEGEFKLQIK